MCVARDAFWKNRNYFGPVTKKARKEVERHAPSPREKDGSLDRLRFVHEKRALYLRYSQS
jgi:hypothetical protein